MISIIEKNNFIEKIIGLQNVDKTALYRLSNFSLPIYIDGKTLLYSTMTKQLVVLEEKEEFCCDKTDMIKYSKDISMLIQNYFLVPISADEYSLNKKLIDIAKLFNKDNDINNFVIFPTTDCNARCFYCFEMGYKRIDMTEQTAEDVANYILKVSNKDKKIKLQWFGGEPLYNSNVIDIITDKLSNAGRDFSSFFVSNGYLFNKGNVDKAKNKWKMYLAQITLDGLEDTYNRIKAYIYKDETSAFQRVLDNIENILSSDMSVLIRYNIDMHNIGEIYQLTDLIIERFSKYDKIAIHPEMLFENVGGKTRTEEERAKIFEEYFKLCEYLKEKNFLDVSVPSRTLSLHRCMADSHSSRAIFPNGKIGKCEHYSDTEHCGDIYNDITDNNNYISWFEKKEEVEYCKQCFYYPSCVELKKCPTVGAPKCSYYDRLRNKYTLECKIKKAYKLWKENRLDSEDL